MEEKAYLRHKAKSVIVPRQSTAGSDCTTQIRAFQSRELSARNMPQIGYIPYQYCKKIETLHR